MYVRKLLEKFGKKELRNMAVCLHRYFPLVKPSRIYDLMLQVDSIDKTLHLLMCHEEMEITLDEIVFMYL